MTLLKTTDFHIVTCSCYNFIWMKIRRTKVESWKFDEIEDGKKSIRKLFHEKMTLFHCCESCLEKSIIMNPFVVSANSKVGHCFMAKLRSCVKTDDICNACLWYFIENFRKEFNFIPITF